MASQQVHSGRMSIRLACDTFVISQTCYRYSAKLSTDNALIADWLVRLTQNQRNWGFGLCFLYLRNVKGFTWNHKRVYRIYRELELNLRIKPHKRLVREKPVHWQCLRASTIRGPLILCMTSCTMADPSACLM